LKIICFRGELIKITDPPTFPYLLLDGEAVPIHKVPQPGEAREGISLDRPADYSSQDDLLASGIEYENYSDKTITTF